jgi:uncharacterized OB-fold protein
MSEPRDDGYDDFLDAIEDGEPYYLEGPSGNGSLPPARVDPETGTRDLTEQPLPDTGEIQTLTQTHVAAPDFADDAPFVVAVVDFGPVSVTGQIRGAEPSAVDIGQEVTIGVDQTETNDERIVVFEPV